MLKADEKMNQVILSEIIDQKTKYKIIQKEER